MSLRAAINAHCRACIYDPQSGLGTWREQVAQCSVVRCGLWPVRPGPRKGPLANPPRDPATVGRGWVVHAVGSANSAHPQAMEDTP